MSAKIGARSTDGSKSELRDEVTYKISSTLDVSLATLAQPHQAQPSDRKKAKIPEIPRIDRSFLGKINRSGQVRNHEEHVA